MISSDELLTVLGVVAVIVAYTLGANWLLRPVGRRDVVATGAPRRVVEQGLGRLWTLAAVVVVAPVLVVLWTALLGLAFVTLVDAGAGRDVADVLGLAAAVVLAVRVLAYVRSDIAVDVARLLPLIVLGVGLVSGAATSGRAVWDEVRGYEWSRPDPWRLMALVVAVELGLRAMHLLGRLVAVCARWWLPRWRHLFRAGLAS